MISLADLGALPQTFNLPANAPVRMTRPDGEEKSKWVRLGKSAWLEIDERSAEVGDTYPWSRGTKTRVRFVPSGLRFVSEWRIRRIWDAPETLALMKDVLDDIRTKVEASRPRLPLDHESPQLGYPKLQWPTSRPAGNEAGVRRQIQKQRLEALRRFGTEAKAYGECELLVPAGAVDRLAVAFSRLPRTADAELCMEPDGKMSNEIRISWKQHGICNLAWGIDTLALEENPRRVDVRQVSPKKSGKLLEKAMRSHLLAMANAVALAMGAISPATTFRFVVETPERILERHLRIKSSEWGLELVQWLSRSD